MSKRLARNEWRKTVLPQNLSYKIDKIPLKFVIAFFFKSNVHFSNARYFFLFYVQSPAIPTLHNFENNSYLSSLAKLNFPIKTSKSRPNSDPSCFSPLNQRKMFHISHALIFRSSPHHFKKCEKSLTHCSSNEQKCTKTWNSLLCHPKCSLI